MSRDEIKHKKNAPVNAIGHLTTCDQSRPQHSHNELDVSIRHGSRINRPECKIPVESCYSTLTDAPAHYRYVQA